MQGLGGQGFGHGQQAFTVPSVDEFVDLDNFLDSYLAQLQTDAQQAQRPSVTTGGPGQALDTNMVTSQPNMLPPQGLGDLAGLGLPGFDLGGVGGASNMLGMQNLGDLQGIQGMGMLQQQLPFNAGLPAGFQGLAAPPGMPAFQGGFPEIDLNALGLAQLAPGPLAPTGMPAGQNTSGGSGTVTHTKPTRGRGGRGGGRGGGGRGKNEADPSSSDAGDSSESGSSDAGEHKSRKKQVTMDDAERRHLALQEKNRRAQRRFRERQKTKLQDLHKQIDELTHKVSSLQNENAALHSRTSILEKVLDMRNEQIQVMQETRESTPFQGAEEELLENVGGQLVQLSPEMIKELGSDQIYKIYQMYVKELSTLLAAQQQQAVLKHEPSTSETGSASGGGGGVVVAAQGAVVPAQQQELEKLVKDLSMMIMRLGVIKPLETRKFIVVSRQYLGNSEAEVIQLWKNVMKAIDLSESQKREVVELKTMFLHKIKPIMEERKLLNVQIQANLPHDTFHTKNALAYIKAHEAVIKLRDNLRAEQHVVLEFAIAVFRGVFRPTQMANLLVKCYPAVPDALGIASALAAELGEPEPAAAMQLAMQLGGYLEHGGGGTLGTNFMTLHPSFVGNRAGGGGPSAGTLPGLMQPASSAAPLTGVAAAVGAAAAFGAGLPGGGGGQGAGGQGSGGQGNTGSDQFGHWMARPGEGGIPDPDQLLAIADQGRPALLQQQAGGGLGMSMDGTTQQAAPTTPSLG